jgi:hypothetical protein
VIEFDVKFLADHGALVSWHNGSIRPADGMSVRITSAPCDIKIGLLGQRIYECHMKEQA